MSDKAMSYSPRHRPKPEFKNLKFLNSGADASWEAFVQGTLLPYVRRLVRPDRAAVTGNQQAAGT